MIAPAVPTAYGYDVFYKIHREDATETEIINDAEAALKEYFA